LKVAKFFEKLLKIAFGKLNIKVANEN